MIFFIQGFYKKRLIYNYHGFGSSLWFRVKSNECKIIFLYKNFIEVYMDQPKGFSLKGVNTQHKKVKARNNSIVAADFWINNDTVFVDDFWVDNDLVFVDDFWVNRG